MKRQNTYRSDYQTGTGNKTDVTIHVPGGGVCSSSMLVIVCDGGNPSAGTVAVRGKAAGSARYIAVPDQNGAAATINLALGDSLAIEGVADAIQVDMTGLAGTGITGWYALLHVVG